MATISYAGPAPCLLCTGKLTSTFPRKCLAPPGVAGMLSELFSSFARNMNWDLTGHEFDFVKDPFPFCSACVSLVLELGGLSQDLEDLEMHLERIKVVTTIAETSILESAEKEDLEESYYGKDTGSPEMYVESRRSIFLKNVNYFRDLTVKKYSPVIRLKKNFIKNFAIEKSTRRSVGFAESNEGLELESPEKLGSPEQLDMESSIEMETDCNESEDGKGEEQAKTGNLFGESPKKASSEVDKRQEGFQCEICHTTFLRQETLRMHRFFNSCGKATKKRLWTGSVVAQVDPKTKLVKLKSNSHAHNDIVRALRQDISKSVTLSTKWIGG